MMLYIMREVVSLLISRELFSGGWFGGGGEVEVEMKRGGYF